MGCTYLYGRAEAPTSFDTPAYMDDNIRIGQGRKFAGK